MDAAKKKAVVRWIGIGLVVVACLIIAGLATFVLTARSFSRSDKIAQGVSIESIDVGGQTREQAIQTIETQWLPGLPDTVSLRLVEAEDLPAADPQAPTGEVAPAADPEAPAEPDTAEAEQQAEDTEAEPEAKADPDVEPETVELTPEQLGVRVQLEQAAEAAYRIGRDGNLWQQAVAQLRARQKGADIQVTAEVDEAALGATLEDLVEEVRREPKDAKVTLSGDRVSIERGYSGRVLDVEASTEHLVAAMADPMLNTSELVVKEKQPEITEEMVAGFQTVLAHYSTPFNPGREQRTHNLRLAMGMVNQKVIRPGERFSANAVIGERLEEKGYKSAPIFLEGEVVPSTGGGVCQVASTLYNAALLANLQINERHHHSRPVDYCPSGRDATLYYGQYDLKFTNTLKHPVLIFGWIEGSRLHAAIIGHDDDKYEVELIRSNISTTGHGTKEIADPELEEGKREVEKPGRSGAKATLTRVVKKDGKEIDRQVLHHDTYPSQTEVVRVGTKKPEPKPEDEDKPALGPDGKPLPPGKKPADGKPGGGSAKPPADKPKPPAAEPKPPGGGGIEADD